MTPHRVQRKRTKGWTTPQCTCGKGAPHKAIYVGRGSRWGNEHQVILDNVCARPGWYVREAAVINGKQVWCGPFDTRQEAAKYASYLYEGGCDRCGWKSLDLSVLRGHDLMCWCPLDQPCHADALLRAANPDT